MTDPGSQRRGGAHAPDRGPQHSPAGAGLTHLDDAGRARMVDVAAKEVTDRLTVTTATVTGLVDTMEARGLATRRPNPTDRRSILIEAVEHAAGLRPRLLQNSEHVLALASLVDDHGQPHLVRERKQDRVRRLQISDVYPGLLETSEGLSRRGTVRMSKIETFLR